MRMRVSASACRYLCWSNNTPHSTTSAYVHVVYYEIWRTLASTFANRIDYTVAMMMTMDASVYRVSTRKLCNVTCFDGFSILISMVAAMCTGLNSPIELEIEHLELYPVYQVDNTVFTTRKLHQLSSRSHIFPTFLTRRIAIHSQCIFSE